MEFRKYFRVRNYIEKLKWLRIFSNIVDSKYCSNLRIHSSSKILNSTIGDNVLINKNINIINANIGNECKVLADTQIHNAILGDYSYVNSNSFVLRAKIGKYCSIGSHVYIGPGSHPMDYVTTHPFTFFSSYGSMIDKDDEEVIKNRNKKSIIIGNDVWIGQGVLIMENVEIGDGAIIGAHAVVTKDIPAYSIVVGTPAKVIKYRFDQDTINKLLNIKWWNWDKEKLRERVEIIKQPVKFIEMYS